MAKTRLKPKCNDLLELLVQRAAQQLQEALPLLQAQGKTVTYNARHSNGTRHDYHGCTGSWGIVVRLDQYGNVVYHDHDEYWYRVSDMCKDVASLCKCADIALERAYGERE